MDKSINFSKTLDVIEGMKLAKVGEHKKWNTMIKKIKNKEQLNHFELECFSNIARIYKDSNIVVRSKVYHTKLSTHDEKGITSCLIKPEGMIEGLFV